MVDMYAVTIKVPKDPNHNPREKKTGPCPVSGKPCTDMTGEHHTVIVFAGGRSAEEVKVWAIREYGHVTRVEGIEL